MSEITYSNGEELDAAELAEFYQHVSHELSDTPQNVPRLLELSTAFVCARDGEKLIGVARGFCDGVRGFFTECKLLPQYQGPGAITRKQGRIEHDSSGIANEMARRVIAVLHEQGAKRVDVMAWGTEVDFLEDLGFRRRGGLVGLTLDVGANAAAQTSATATV